MRTYHRWLSLLFGLFIIWIAATGLLSHGAALYADAVEPSAATAAAPAASASIIPAVQAHEGEAMNSAAVPNAAPTATAFTCPPDMTCRPRPAPDSARAWVSFFHHLHAGEEFGAIGTTLSILSGFALLFFAISGLWMYLELYRGRLMRTSKGAKGGRFFWK